MSSPDQLSDFVRAAGIAECETELWESALTYFHACGFPFVSYHDYGLLAPAALRDAERVIFADGYPSDWVEYYLKEHFFELDPIVRFAGEQLRPVYWSDAFRKPVVTRQENAFKRALHSAGLVDGIAIGSTGPLMRRGYVGLGFGTGCSRDVSAEALADLHTAALMLHHANSRIRSSDAVQQFDLSPREQEVLSLMMRGHSNARISDTLNVSRHTTDTITRRLFDKLGVSDRTSAVVRGMTAGLWRFKSSSLKPAPPTRRG